jgi:hypothetical protein
MSTPSEEPQHHQQNRDNEEGGRDKYLPENLFVFW